MSYAMKWEDAKPRELWVSDTFFMYFDPEFEAQRVSRMRNLVTQYGRIFRKGAEVPRSMRREPTTRCYDNAMDVAMQHALVYCEGYLRVKLLDGSIVGMAHGWCCNPVGHIIDPTAYKNQNHPSIEYIGIPILVGYSLAWKARHGYYGVLDGTQDGSTEGIYFDHTAKWRSPFP